MPANRAVRPGGAVSPGGAGDRGVGAATAVEGPVGGGVPPDELWVHHRYLASISRSILGDPEAAEDVVQDAYVSALQNLGGLDPGRGARGWLATVVRRASIDEARRRGRQALPVERIPERADRGGVEAFEALLARETLAEARRALSVLSTRELRLLVSRVAEGASMRELAAAEGSSVRAVESVLRRARSRLTGALGRERPPSCGDRAARRRHGPGSDRAPGTLRSVPARVDRQEGEPPPPGDLEEAMRGEGLSPSRWGNAPGDTYGWHSHSYRKVITCLRGGIVFHTRDTGDVELAAGDRMVLEPGTDHAATVGPDGVECAEAHVEVS